MLAYAFLAVTRTRKTDPGKLNLIPLTCNEIRHLLITVIAPSLDWSHRLHWSTWRRRHQTVARQLHYSRQLSRCVNTIAVGTSGVQAL
nr:hypothetical protein [Glycomyces tenuis]